MHLRSCPICDEVTLDAGRMVRSYNGGGYHVICSCQYCDLQYSESRDVPGDLYEYVYINSANIPGYNRYTYFQSEVKSQPSPLDWLSEQEPAYWFIRDELKKVGQSASILEIGSGLGYLTYAINQAGYNITGIDISEKAVSGARQLFGNIYRHENLFELASEPARYDLVILTEVIEHLTAPIAFLQAASRILAPGGTILITTPNKSFKAPDASWDTDNPPVHLWWFSETAIRQLARRAKLDVRLCDFTSMYTGVSSPHNRSEVAGFPAWLDRNGNVTPDAITWVARYNRDRDKKKALAKWIPSSASSKIKDLLNRFRRRQASPRSWQIGAALRTSDHGVAEGGGKA